MKTTTKKSAEKRLAKLNVSKTSIAYHNVLKVINGEKTIRPVYTSGTGRFTSNQDHTQSTWELLTSIGIEVKLSNDSPRGGLTGNLITILTKIKN